MNVCFEPLKKKTAELLLNHYVTTYLNGSDSSRDLALSDFYDLLVEPPQSDLGDLAFGCFKLAKALKMSPMNVAKELESTLVLPGYIDRIQAMGPYLNIFLTLEAFQKDVLLPILSGNVFSMKLSENAPSTMVEYSQPNTHKELHVGHMRNICLGDAVVRLLKYANYPTLSATFPGDVGTHVAKCLWYMKYHNSETVPATGKGEWLGKMYSRGHILLEDQIGTPQEDINRKQLTEILKQLSAKSGEFFDLWKTTKKWSVELMSDVYQWANITFDHWYWESDVDADSVKWIQSLYEEGKLVKSQGAIGMDLSEEKLGFCLLLKSDGTGLYATKDLELARRKFQDIGIDRSIYIVDMRQALHFKQVFRTLEILGFEKAKSCFHLQYNYVELPEGAMSSRSGNIIPLMDLVQNMEQKVKDQYLERYRNEWSQSEIDLVAHQVAQGAIRYGMVRMDTAKKIVFDMSEWLKLDGESGPFIQYSAARITSLLEKLSFSRETVFNAKLLIHPAERSLLQHLLFFNTVMKSAADQFKPALVCTYLYQLAKKFNYFYHECSVGQAEEELKHARLALCSAVGMSLKKGLELLGIPSPTRM